MRTSPPDRARNNDRDGHGAGQRNLLSLVNFTHPALAEFTDDSILSTQCLTQQIVGTEGHRGAAHIG